MRRSGSRRADAVCLNGPHERAIGMPGRGRERGASVLHFVYAELAGRSHASLCDGRAGRGPRCGRARVSPLEHDQVRNCEPTEPLPRAGFHSFEFGRPLAYPGMLEDVERLQAMTKHLPLLLASVVVSLTACGAKTTSDTRGVASLPASTPAASAPEAAPAGSS